VNQGFLAIAIVTLFNLVIHCLTVFFPPFGGIKLNLNYNLSTSIPEVVLLILNCLA